MKVLTVRNPWALAIFLGKDIENRDWPTGVRGEVAIHASASMGKAEYLDAAETILLCGGTPPTFEECKAANGKILGTVNIHGCVTYDPSPWFFGRYGLQLRDQKRFDEPIPAKGALGWWEWSR